MRTFAQKEADYLHTTRVTFENITKNPAIVAELKGTTKGDRQKNLVGWLVVFLFLTRKPGNQLTRKPIPLCFDKLEPEVVK